MQPTGPDSSDGPGLGEKRRDSPLPDDRPPDLPRPRVGFGRRRALEDPEIRIPWNPPDGRLVPTEASRRDDPGLLPERVPGTDRMRPRVRLPSGVRRDDPPARATRRAGHESDRPRRPGAGGSGALAGGPPRPGVRGGGA